MTMAGLLALHILDPEAGAVIHTSSIQTS